METSSKCSAKTHKEVDAILFCEKCQIFMCNKCLNHHKELFENHQLFTLDKNNNELFINFCRIDGHEKKFEYFCKTHNELCCVCCFTKINNKRYGQHKDCDICTIDDIKEEKKIKLSENKKYLKELSNNIENSINELKIIIEKMNNNKEEIKINVQKIFTKIKNALNEREDELLLEIDKKYDENFSKEDFLKESIKLPNKIKKSLEKGNISEDDWNDNNKLSSLINVCINIEKNIEMINSLNDSIKKCQKFKEYKILFSPENESLDKFILSIKEFGKINISAPGNEIEEDDDMGLNKLFL